MTNLITIFWNFFLANLSFIFKINKSGKMYLSGLCLWTNSSFRLPLLAGKDWLIGAKTLYRTVYAIWNAKKPFVALNESPTALLDYTNGNEISFFDLKKLNVEQMNSNSLGYFIIKNHLALGQNKITRMLWILLVGFYSFPIVLLTLFLPSKFRANGALIIAEITEIIHVIRMLKKFSIKEVFDFHPYEIDSNLCAVILMKLGIRVVKMPSPGPLALHNRILIANAVVTSTPYHLDELKHFRSSIITDEVIEWVPERALTYIDFYKNKKLCPPMQTVGFYSHASWVRKMEGHVDDGMNVDEAENIILSSLADYMTLNPTTKLVVFLHPREKVKELKPKVFERYQTFFSGLNYEILESDQPSSHEFHKVDVGVVSFSTIVFERLFCGFKTLLFSYKNPGFPIEGSALNNICIKSKLELLKKLPSALKVSKEEFFANNNITKYAFYHSPLNRKV